MKVLPRVPTREEALAALAASSDPWARRDRVVLERAPGDDLAEMQRLAARVCRNCGWPEQGGVRQWARTHPAVALAAVVVTAAGAAVGVAGMLAGAPVVAGIGLGVLASEVAMAACCADSLLELGHATRVLGALRRQEAAILEASAGAQRSAQPDPAGVGLRDDSQALMVGRVVIRKRGGP